MQIAIAFYHFLIMWGLIANDLLTLVRVVYFCYERYVIYLFVCLSYLFM